MRPTYQPENGFLLDVPRPRKTEKSAFLKTLEKAQEFPNLVDSSFTLEELRRLGPTLDISKVFKGGQLRLRLVRS